MGLALLLVVLLLLIAWLLARLIRRPMTLWQSVLYHIAHVITRLLWRGTADRLLPIEPGQGAVIVTNHRSSVDPFFVQLAVGQKLVHWMVAKEFVEHRALGWFLNTARVIPTNRAGVDTAATKQAIRHASSGALVGMLPEGRINMTDEFLLPVRPGAALIALHAQVPLIPCYIEGAPFNKLPHSPFLMRARVRVHVGDAIDLSPYYGQENEHDIANRVILQAMKAVGELAQQGHFQPRLAGRRWKPTQEELEAAMSESERRGNESHDRR